MSRYFKSLEDVKGLLESVQNMRGLYSFSSIDDGVEYLSFDAFFTRLKYMYLDRKMMFYEGENEIDTFERMWLMYLNTTRDNYIRAFDTMLQKYEPLENYNRVEDSNVTLISESETEKTGSEIQAIKGDILKKSGTDTSTTVGEMSNKTGSQTVNTNGDMSIKNGSQIQTNDYGKKTSTYANGYNVLAENEIPIKDFQEDSGIDIIETQFNGTKDSTDVTQTTSFDNFKDSANYSNTRTLDTTDSTDYTKTDSFLNRKDLEKKTDSTTTNSVIKGNVGVMTTQSMALEEIELRKKNLMLDYIDSFFKTYTYYC